MKYCIVLVSLLLSFQIFASYPWPISNYKIGHILSSYQQYDGAPYFHHALDIVAEKKSKVFVSAPGIVKKIGFYGNYDDELYYEVVIEDKNGNQWKYHHLDEWSISSDIKQAYRNHQKIKSGIYIGKLVYWPFRMNGKPFHHLHLDIIDKDKNYLNPFHFLDPIIDTTPPEIIKMGKYKLKNGYTIYAEVRDLIDNNDFYHPPKKIEISVDGSPSIIVWDFSILPGGSDKKKFIKDLYIDELTQGNYQSRKYVFNLGFDKKNKYQFPTSSGEHQVRLTIYDFAGNQAEQIFTYKN